MLKLYRDLKTAYYLLSIGGGLLILFLGRRHLLAAVACAFAWIIAVAYLLNRVAAKRVSGIINLMQQQCRVRDFIEAYQPLISRCGGRPLHQYMLLNLSSGYLNLGDCEAARRLLEQIPDKFGEGRFDSVRRLFYYNNWAGYYLRMHDAGQAARMLDRMEEGLRSAKMPQAQRKGFEDRCREKRARLEMENGHCEAAEAVFRNALEGQYLLGQVYARLCLGEIARRQGRLEDARREFGFAAQFGGDSAYAAEARAALERMG